ncbi:hypothetical protein FRX31_024824 [Thalictrum thalictroides]|uniref:Uncharacterized protein n=1 Tax=Thalictrum thalictroides TaxID=46969 RepID=A0A7J6VKE1_THATH|nr:hypothetical protein FRX31_024824 [Thalictrum thalictroides]
MLSGLTVGQGEIAPYNNEYDIGWEQAISLFPTLASCPDYYTKYGIKNSFFEMEFMNRTDVDWCV